MFVNSKKLVTMKSGILLILLFTFSTFCCGQEQTITGIVYDEDKMALPFTTVTVKHTNQENITDLQGKFTINVQQKDTLKFSFIGYKTKEIVVGNQREFSIKLEPRKRDSDTIKIVILKKAIDSQKVPCNSKKIIHSNNK